MYHFRDSGSSKTGVLGPRAADAAKFAELNVLRRQLAALSEPIRESARFTYLLNKDLKRRDLQEFQCTYLGKIQRILEKQLDCSGFDVRKFKIGGYERGIYEKFFRVEPRLTMTKAQFTTALRRCFGEDFLKSESTASKLFDSFDMDRTDALEWRAFIFLLTILMQPLLLYDEHLRYGFALWSSVGSLDLDCTDKISLAAIKEILCAPVLLTLRTEIKHNVDAAWIALVDDDLAATQAASKTFGDVDRAMVSFALFQKLLEYPTLKLFREVAKPFGKRDPRPWLTVMEEKYYHPLLVAHLKVLRREQRNENECDAFLALRKMRLKQMVITYFKNNRTRRVHARKLLVALDIRTRNGACAWVFDRWRRLALEQAVIVHAQRIVRGFTARRRRDFLKSVNKRVVKVQVNVRKLQSQQVYRALAAKQRWAAVTIQRHSRAFLARRRVRTIVEAKFDTGRRLIAKKRAEWIKDRQFRAAVCLQMLARRFIKRRRKMHQREQETKVELAKMEIDEMLAKIRVENNVYQQKIIEWYAQRKIDDEKERFWEEHTAEQRSKIIAYRNKEKEYERIKLQKEREAYIEKLEEARIEDWLKTWDEKIDRRMKECAARCRRALQLPESPEEVELKKELQLRIKGHVKHVLRRADKQKIPMEIPQAMALATQEIIELEVHAEKKRAEDERRKEAEEAQKKEEDKAENARQNDLRMKKRRRKWAAVTLQNYYRGYLARRVLRAKAYERYKKMFDKESLNYYYVDKRTRKTFWKKPKSLGSYDIDCEDGWMVIPDKTYEPSKAGLQARYYFYEPKSWTVMWTQPIGTLMCEVCGDDFVVAKLTRDLRQYCEKCLDQAVIELKKTMHPSLILFRPLPGNLETASGIRISTIKEISWYKHMLAMDPVLAKSFAGEEAKIKEKAAKEREAKLLQCTRCNTAKADVICDMCNEQYCTPCFAHKHKKAPWDKHTFQEYNGPPSPAERKASFFGFRFK